MAMIPAAGYISNNVRTQTEMKQGFEDLLAGTKQIPGAGVAELTATIVSGSITPVGSGGVVAVDTEASAATDDLTNIVTTNYPDGSCLLVRNANSARFVVVKPAAGGAGQLNLDRTADYVLDDTKKWLLLQRRGADWHEIMRGPQRLAMPTVAKSATFTVQKEDLGKVFLCTGTFTVNLLAAAGAGNGFVVTIRNMSTGTLTLDANGSELIDGATTLVLSALGSAVVSCDGTAWTTLAQTAQTPSVGNPIINGSMEVWQRGTVFTSASNATVSADRWFYGNTTGAVVNLNRSTSVPTVAQAGVLFNYSLEVDVTTADATIAAGELAFLSQRIEGYNWRQFAQRQFTLSFWVLSSKTGTHCVAFRNNVVVDRSYVAEYTVNAANTWEYKTITVSASPSTGNWNYTTGTGVEVAFGLAVGTNYHTTSGAWNTGNFFSTSAQVNVLDNTANFFRITGVRMDLGAVATPIQFVPFEEELMRCQRYYQKSFPYDTAPAQNAGFDGGANFVSQVGGSAAFALPQPFIVTMRTAPSVTTYNPAAFNNLSRNVQLSADDPTTSIGSIGSSRFVYLLIGPAAGASAGQEHVVHWTANAEL